MVLHQNCRTKHLYIHAYFKVRQLSLPLCVQGYSMKRADTVFAMFRGQCLLISLTCLFSVSVWESVTAKRAADCSVVQGKTSNRSSESLHNPVWLITS